MEPWLIAAITTATGGVFAIAGGWLGSRWGRNNEHSHWMRNEKYTVYKRVFSSLEEHRTGIVSDWLLNKTQKDPQVTLGNSLDFELVSSPNVYECRKDCLEAIFLLYRLVYIDRSRDPAQVNPLIDRTSRSLNELKDAMRRDISVERLELPNVEN
ncbi:hypothetical protein GCM10027403_14570 [Arthrobacter tecti]